MKTKLYQQNPAATNTVSKTVLSLAQEEHTTSIVCKGRSFEQIAEAAGVNIKVPFTNVILSDWEVNTCKVDGFDLLAQGFELAKKGKVKYTPSDKPAGYVYFIDWVIKNSEYRYCIISLI